MFETVALSHGRFSVRAALVVLNAAVIAIGALGLWWTWSRSVEEATTRTVNTVTLLEQGAGAVFDRAALALSLIAQGVRHHAQTGPSGARQWPAVQLPPLQSREIQGIDLFDEWGDLVCETSPCARFSIADRGYFRQLRDTFDTAPTLAGPLVSRRDGREILVMAQALRGADGTFLGVATALLPIERLRGLVRTAQLGPESIASLRGDDLRLIVRAPMPGAPVEPARPEAGATPLHVAIAARPTAGVLTTVSPLDGQERLTAYRRLANHPVYAIVGYSRAEFTGEWKRLLPWMAALMALLLLASLIIDRAMASRRRAMARVRALYDAAPCGYHALDAHGRYRALNATELGWLGMPREAVVGRMGPADFTTEEGRRVFQASFARLQTAGVVRDVEIDLVGRHGRTRRVSVSATAVHDDRGVFAGSNVVMHDITALHEARQLLSRQAADQQAMLESDAVGMLLERDGRIVWRNQAMSRLFGHPPERWPLLRLCDLMRDASVLTAWEGAPHGDGDATPADARMKALCEFRRADGGAFSGELSRLMLSERQSFVVISDLTYLRQAEAVRLAAARLESQNLALREAARLKDAFIGDMSHELRTPLNGILGFAHLLAEDDPTRSEAERRHYAGRILDSGKHLLALVENMLSVARHQAARDVQAAVAVDARQALGEAVEMLAAKIAEARLSVDVSVERGAETVVTDPLRLRQILLNLLDNAIKFSHAGGRVRLRAWRASPAQWAVSIEDEGVGIAEHALAALFQPFTRGGGDGQVRQADRGLGLSMSRELARAQGGDIAVQSTIGRGSTFHLTLPASPGGAAAPGRPAPAAPRAPS